MHGKAVCKILKDIRRQIAQENDIELITSECKHQGDCPGTCPKCEAEVRYLEDALRKRQQAGKAVAVAGVAAALLVGTAGCASYTTTEGDIAAPSSATQSSSQALLTPGAIAYPSDTEPLQGEPAEELPGDDTSQDDGTP